MLITLKTPQSKTNIAPPQRHEITKLKNSGIIDSKFVKKNVIAALGTTNIDIKTKGLVIPNLIFNFRLIIIKFNPELIETQIPIPTISALIPIIEGRNQMLKKRKTEPIK